MLSKQIFDATIDCLRRFKGSRLRPAADETFHTRSELL